MARKRVQTAYTFEYLATVLQFPVDWEITGIGVDQRRCMFTVFSDTPGTPGTDVPEGQEAPELLPPSASGNFSRSAPIPAAPAAPTPKSLTPGKLKDILDGI